MFRLTSKHASERWAMARIHRHESATCDHERRRPDCQSGARRYADYAGGRATKLLAGGLLRGESEGRHLYYRVAGPRVVSLLEHRASIGPSEPMHRRALNRAVERLRFARCCDDHLAGSLGVGIPRRCSAMATSRRETERPSSSRRTVSNGSVTWDWML